MVLDIGDTIRDDTFTGLIFPYAGINAPSSFLVCDGAAYDNNNYERLLKVVEGRYGVSSATNFTVDTTNDEIDATSHGLNESDIILFSSDGSLPGGLSANQLYYVINASTDTFQVSTSSGGSAVDITSTGSGTHSYHTKFNVPDLRSSTPIGKGQRTYELEFNASNDLVIDTGLNIDNTVDDNYDGDYIRLHSNHNINGFEPIFFTGGTIVDNTNINANQIYWARFTASGNFDLNANELRPYGSIQSAIRDDLADHISMGDQNVDGDLKQPARFVPENAVSWIETGTAVKFTTDGTPPSNLTDGNTYYAVKAGRGGYFLADTREKAVMKDVIFIDGKGSGTHKLTVTMSDRSLSEKGGMEETTLSIEQTPPIDNLSTDKRTSDGNNDDTYTNLEQVGRSDSQNNMPPYTAVNFIIKT